MAPYRWTINGETFGLVAGGARTAIVRPMQPVEIDLDPTPRPAGRALP